MKKNNFLRIAGFAALIPFVLGCSEVKVFVNGDASTPNGGGNGSGTGGADQSLVTFHASVESRNMTRSISPLTKNVQVQLYAYNGASSSTAGAPVAEGRYESPIPGQLSGLSGYKMYLSNGIYNFYAFSENIPYAPTGFTNGLSRPLFNGFDYLWWAASQQDVTSQQVSIPIVFLHSASQVAFEVTAGTGITINQLVMAHITAPQDGAQMDLSTGVIPPTSQYQSGSPEKMGINGLLAQYIVLPLKTSVPMTVYFDVLVNGEGTARTYSVDVPVPDGELKAGNSYLFKAIINANTVDFPSVSVTDWIDVDETGKPLYPRQ